MVNYKFKLIKHNGNGRVIIFRNKGMQLQFYNSQPRTNGTILNHRMNVLNIHLCTNSIPIHVLESLVENYLIVHKTAFEHAFS